MAAAGGAAVAYKLAVAQCSQPAEAHDTEEMFAFPDSAAAQ